MLDHQFIIYVAVIEYYEDYESNIARNEYFYTLKEDAEAALQNMMTKEVYEQGGEWQPYEQCEGDASYDHSFNNMSAYIRMQIVNGPK